MIKKPLVMMHMEVYKREIIPKLYLAMKLAKIEGYQVLIGNIEKFAEKKSGSGIYFNKDHGVWSESSLIKIKNNGYYITAFDEEGLIYGSDTIYNQSRGSIKLLDECDGIFLWGNKQLKTISSSSTFSNYNKHVVGAIKFDLYKKMKITPSGGRYKKVLINTRFTGVNGFFSSFSDFVEHLKNLGFIKTKEDESFYYSSYIADKKIYAEFERLIDVLGRDSSFQLTIRPHPAECVDNYNRFQKKYSNVVVDSNTELLEQIIEHDCVIHDACTTGIEAMFIGVPVYSLRPSDLEGAYDALANDFSVQFNSASSLYQELIEADPRDYFLNDERFSYLISNWNDNVSAVETITKVFNDFDVSNRRILKRLNPTTLTKDYFYSLFDRYVGKGPLLKIINKNSKIGELVEKRTKRLVVFPEIDISELIDKASFLCRHDETLGELSSYHIKKTSAQSFIIYCD